jgi:hypothetical protein
VFLTKIGALPKKIGGQSFSANKGYYDGQLDMELVLEETQLRNWGKDWWLKDSAMEEKILSLLE